MGKGFASPVPGRGGTHQTRVELVLHLALEDPIFDQNRELRRYAFVVYV